MYIWFLYMLDLFLFFCVFVFFIQRRLDWVSEANHRRLRVILLPVAPHALPPVPPLANQNAP